MARELVKADNLSFYVHRENADGVEQEDGSGYLIHTLWMPCPNCGEQKMIARWKETGGEQIGALECDHCGAKLAEAI